ncbi:pituitary tumor-transforming gene 1 protein-interacting protein-like [Carcharodon carcharias]|uniref:pituitary tumor-transforming gene 1 protein-interacting protein-like n=1 Tax=Carcharodon carcharias TaxID=13397 RepID=UPI001B7EE0A2|nr:pituitary tumor-transforming gene 1 protein-interacting protein-like [Carcharodon carcharias]XP_041057619.1 pituitary tumor-transforming gene 1 protein-interacting protein-like [Carcharodon carcharias]
MKPTIWLPGIIGILFGLNLGALGQVTSAPSSGCTASSNNNCEQCLRNVSCLWCNTNNKCVDYPVRTILPPKSLCHLSDARWGVCWVNFEALIIAMSVVGGVLILSLCICCYCCCRSRKRKQLNVIDQKMEREREQRRMRQEERKSEMKVRHDEIRKKYGLFKEPNSYSKFENN